MHARQLDRTWSILSIAQEAGIQLKPRAGRPDQYTANCPFCEDTKKHLNIHGSRDVFNCYRCGSKGGTIRFYALLHKCSEAAAKEELRNRFFQNTAAGSSFPRKQIRRHPAEGLSGEELRKLGFVGAVPNWYQLRNKDPERAKALADWIWEEKLKHDQQFNSLLNQLKRGVQPNVESNYINRTLNS